VLIFALELGGFVLAENAADEESVDNGTMAITTIVTGIIYTSDQSIVGTGFANTDSNLGVVSSDGSQILNLRNLGSGSGFYGHNSSIYVRNNVKEEEGYYVSSNQYIYENEDTNAIYAGMSFQIPGSFKAKTLKSLWKDQTYSRNYAGIISMNSLFNYARMLNKESTNNMWSNRETYADYLWSRNSSVGSSMDINSKFDGSAHLGVTLTDVRGGIRGDVSGDITGIAKAKANNDVLMDEDYIGSFNLTKKLEVDISKLTDYGDYDANYEGDNEDYPWLPCACYAGWDNMVINDQRYHSAKGFFDCTTCWPPAPCKKA
jgi:hypothetical protein